MREWTSVLSYSTHDGCHSTVKLVGVRWRLIYHRAILSKCHVECCRMFCIHCMVRWCAPAPPKQWQSFHWYCIIRNFSSKFNLMRALTLSELRPFPLSRKLRYAGSIRDLLPAKQRKLPIAFKSGAPNVQGKICSSASLVGTQNPYNDMLWLKSHCSHLVL